MTFWGRVLTTTQGVANTDLRHNTQQNLKTMVSRKFEYSLKRILFINLFLGFNYIPPRMTKSKHNGGSPVLQQFLNEEPVHIRGQADRVNFNILGNCLIQVSWFRIQSELISFPTTAGSVENIDPSINAERLKLIYRIKKCFRTHAEETFKEVNMVSLQEVAELYQPSGFLDSYEMRVSYASSYVCKT